MEALARELREETGLELPSAHLLDARSYGVRRHGVSWHLTALFHAVDLPGGAPVVTETDGSTDAAVWVPPADLRTSTLSPAAACSGAGPVATGDGAGCSRRFGPLRAPDEFDESDEPGDGPDPGGSADDRAGRAPATGTVRRQRPRTMAPWRARAP